MDKMTRYPLRSLGRLSLVIRLAPPQQQQQQQEQPLSSLSDLNGPCLFLHSIPQPTN